MTGAQANGDDHGRGWAVWAPIHPARLEITRGEGGMRRPEAANMRFGSLADVPTAGNGR